MSRVTDDNDMCEVATGEFHAQPTSGKVTATVATANTMNTAANPNRSS